MMPFQWGIDLTRKKRKKRETQHALHIEQNRTNRINKETNRMRMIFQWGSVH